MRFFRAIIIGILFLSYTSTKACKYTIREIGFSTLSKVTYVLYRIDGQESFFSKQLQNNLSDSNVKGIGINAVDNASDPIIEFALKNKLSLPAYILVAPDGRMLPLANSDVLERTLNSPVRSQLLDELPFGYAAVLLIDGKNKGDNKNARGKIAEACRRIDNILPNMPKQVNVGPKLMEISNEEFEQEKVLLWSFGINSVPEKPMALVVYGKGRIMGEKIPYAGINDDTVYKYLSIIGADCECGLDKKWMLGYQMPLNWPSDIRQDLNDELGFDVDNPMILTEMSRILAIENKVSAQPDGVSFEPVLLDLEKAFNEVPEVAFTPTQTEESEESMPFGIILYSLLGLLIFIGIVSYFIVRKKN